MAFALTAILVIVLDRISKAIILSALVVGQSIPVIPRVFHITLCLNKGAAFGMLQAMPLFFSIISILVSIGILVLYRRWRRTKGVMFHIALGLILGGALGNLADRLRYGTVIDFLDFRIWPVFNIADSAITAGACLLAFLILLEQKRGKS